MSRADRFDRGDFEERYGERTEPVTRRSSESRPSRVATRCQWPIVPSQLKRVGDAITGDRDGTGRPHKGIDLFAEAGTAVLAAQAGRVLRVIDGRRGKASSLRRAGLFVDVQGVDGLIYRYLHLGNASVQKGDSLLQGAVLGTIAPPFTSGLAEEPHLHFEIRQQDYQRTRKDYGLPLDPRRFLPTLRS